MFDWFVTSWMQSAGAFLWSWASIDIIVGCVAVAVAVLLPKFVDNFSDLRKWAITVAVVAFTLAGAIAHGYKNGLAEKQRQWDAALVKEIDGGERAASDAADFVGPMSTDRSLFRSDPFNRDRGKPPVR
jgi:apolipoprotein N-acyltransferase